MRISARMPAVCLLRENWCGLPDGPLRRENGSRAEFATRGEWRPRLWHHAGAANAGTWSGSDSPFRICRCGRRAWLEKIGTTPAWGAALVLTQGPEPWQNYTAAITLTSSGRGPAGLVARYRTARDFYAAVFEDGTFKLLRMLEGMPQVLAAAPAPTAHSSVRLTLSVHGDRLAATAAGFKLTATDGCLAAGGIGLWAEDEATFGTLVVRTGADEAQRLAVESVQSARRLARQRRAWPAMRMLADVDVRGHALGRQLRLADLDGDGRAELLFAVPGGQRGRHWNYQKLVRLSALNLDGRVMWERGSFAPDSCEIAGDLPVQAADRGCGTEVLVAFGDSLEVLDPRTGRTRQRVDTPRHPRMEPYWDEISQYWGDGHGDDLPRLLPDCLRLCNLTGRHPYGDLLLKDRYHCAWGLDGQTLKPLWTHRCNTGHYPFACDLDGVGRDTIILGYSRLDHRGKLIGRIFLDDHPDACFAYRDAAGLRHVLHPCGEAGFVDERGDGKIDRLHLGHVQHLSVADFDSARPGLERLVVTYHGAEGIVALLDEQNRLIRKVERYGAGAVCQPVNWTGDGRELIGFSPRLADGGLWNEAFELVVPFPDGPRPAKYLDVHDVFGWGVDQLIVWDETRLQIYGPAVRPRATRRHYAPLRSWPNSSNYQVQFSLPRWQ